MDIETVRQIANLAQLEISEDETQRYQKELTQIFEAFSQLETLNIKEVLPLKSPAPLQQVLRVDRVESGLSLEEALAAAPDRQNSCFRVPPVI